MGILYLYITQRYSHSWILKCHALLFNSVLGGAENLKIFIY